MRKKILSALTAAIMFSSSAALAMTGAPYEAETGVEVLKTVSTNSSVGWNANGSSRIETADGSLHVSADGVASASITAGADLYSETAPSGAMFWDFESQDDVFTQVYGQANITDPSDIPEGKMSNFYATTAYWTSPAIVPFSDDMYANATLGTVYNGEKTPPSPGSGSVAKVTTGKNDWNRATLGIRVKLSEQNFVPGKTYVLSYYTLDNSKDRELYCNVTKPSQIEPTSSGAVNWLSSSAEPVGRVRQYWTNGSTEVTPQADDFEDGYAVLWLGIKAAPCLRSEAVYFDSVSLVPKDELSDGGITFRAKVKSKSAVDVSGTLQDSTVMSAAAAECDDWSDISAKLSIDKTSAFFIGENRGRADGFKINFSSADDFYVKDVSIYKATENGRFQDLSSLAGSTVGISVKVFADVSGEASAVLEVDGADGSENIIAKKDVILAEGANTVSVSAALPDGVYADSRLMFYMTDESGKIISERKQNISMLYANGANICTSSLNVSKGIQIFGGGDYLVEFDTNNLTAEFALVKIGQNTFSAAVNNGVGLCEVTLSLSDITDGTTVEVDGIDAYNITVKKVAD